jgi:hypothetical protein
MLNCKCGAKKHELLKPAIKDGKIVADLKCDNDVRQFVLDQLRHVEL